MWRALRAVGRTLGRLVDSRKAVVAIAGAISAGALRLGWDVDSDTVGLVLTPIVGYVVGQGIADAGAGRKDKNGDRAP